MTTNLTTIVKNYLKQEWNDFQAKRPTVNATVVQEMNVASSNFACWRSSHPIMVCCDACTFIRHPAEYPRFNVQTHSIARQNGDGYCSCPECRCLVSILLILLWVAVSIVYFVLFTSDRIVIQRHHSFTVNQFNNNSRMFICPCSNEEIAYDTFVKLDIEVEFPVLINQMDNSSTHMCNGSKLNQVSSKACISFLKGFTEVLGSSTFFSPYLVTEKDIEERIRRFARLTSNEIMMTLLFGSEIASDVLAQLQGADTRYKNPRSLQSSLENQRKNLQTFQNTTMELFIATLPNVTIDHAKYFKECDALYCDERRHLNGYEIMFNVVAKVGGWMSISMVTAGVLLSILNCVAKSFYKDKPVRDIF